VTVRVINSIVMIVAVELLEKMNVVYVVEMVFLKVIAIVMETNWTVIMFVEVLLHMMSAKSVMDQVSHKINVIVMVVKMIA